jgi:DeoR/GlpR family transcriptional regulator of sugar metabolism
MEQIATQLGVSARTISEDLRNFEVSSKLKPSKTASSSV